jgi:hypothetical protein
LNLREGVMWCLLVIDTLLDFERGMGMGMGYVEFDCWVLCCIENCLSGIKILS